MTNTGINSTSISTNEFNTFISDLKNKYPILSEKEVDRLAEVIHTGSPEERQAAKNKLCLSNAALILKLSRKFMIQGMTPEDMFQYAFLACLEKVEKYNPSKGKFSTYMHFHIENSLKENMTLTVHDMNTLRKYNKVKNELSMKIGREPSVEELADALHSKVNHVKEKLNQFSAACTEASLEEPIGGCGEDGEALSLKDVLVCTSSNPEEIIIQKEERKALFDAIRRLPRNEAVVICYMYGFYGLNDGHPWNCSTVAQKLDTSRQNVNNMFHRAEQKLSMMMSDWGYSLAA